MQVERHIPTYILAGGRSRRFGSDKARAQLNGEPLLTRVARLAQPVAGEDIWAIADRAERYADLGIETLGDRQPGLGPLAGLETALEHRLERHGRGWLLLLSCDLLHLEAGWVALLREACTADSRAVAFREPEVERLQPLLAIYHTDALPIVRERLTAGEHSMQRLLGDAAIRAIALPPPADWPRTLGANTPQDLPLERE